MHIMLVAMLNGIHIQILTPMGDFHMHPHTAGDICHCVFVTAFVQGEHGHAI